MPPRNPNPRWDAGPYQALRRKWKPRVEAGSVACWRCGRPIVPGKIRQKYGNTWRWVDGWHLGHSDVDRSIIMGPEHWTCNLSAAGRKAGRMSRARAGRRRPRVSAPFTTSQNW